MDTSRRKRRYGELSLEEIIAAAVDVAGQDGMGAITMRRLAKELGLSPTVSYYYVRSKDEILDLVINEVLSRVTIPSPDVGDWRERLRRLYSSLCLETLPYAGLNQLLQRRPLVPRAVEIGDAVADAVRDAGFSPEIVPFCVRTLSGFYHGHVGYYIQTDGSAPSLRRGQGTPPTRQNLAILRPEEILPQFEFGLNVVLAGIDGLPRDRDVA